jgi:cardiolipin synthase
MTSVGALFLILAVLFAFFPRLLAYPLFLIFAWLGGVLFYRSYKLHREGRRKKETHSSHRESEG